MIVRKLSVFLLVMAFHVVVLGVVYLVTRSEGQTVENSQVVSSKKLPEPKPKVADKPSKPSPEKEDTTKKITAPNYDHTFYTVKKGDFLSKIATKFKVSSQQIMSLNNMKDPNRVFVGQKLKIPTSR